MEMLADWIEVDESRYEQAESKCELRHVVVEVNVSPYDVPQQVRGEYCEERDRFVIEFRYISNEPTRAVRLDDHATGRVGKNSGRLYSIELDVNAMDATSVALQLKADEAIDGLSQVMKSRPARKKNYALARQVLDDYWAPITQLMSVNASAGQGATR